MMRYTPVLLTACLVFGSAHPGGVRAQQPSNAPAQSTLAAGPRLPAAARVDIVLSRFQGEKAEKKVSSLPYTVYVREGRPTQLTLGNNVPIPSGDKGYTYQNVGVQITCNLEPTGDSRYWLMINFTDSSVAETAAQSPVLGVPPVIQSMSLQNMVTLRDGQTLQFGSAVDKITGDTLRAEVTLTIVK